jgi:multiple sugar transport system substrate-binding protein
MQKTGLKFVVLVIMVWLIVGCSQGTEPQTGNSVTSKSNKIVYIGGKAPDLFQQELDKDTFLKEKFPNLEIEYYQINDLENVLLSGVKPDVIHAWGFHLVKMKEANMLGDMSDLIKKYNFDIGQFVPGHIDNIRTFGKNSDDLVAVPDSTISGTYAINATAYNKDIFDRFAVPYPKDGMTWDDMFALAKRMNRTEGGVKYIGMAHYFAPFNIYKMFGLNYLNKDGKADLSQPLWQDVFKINQRFYEFGTDAEIFVKPDTFAKDRNIAIYVGAMGALENATIAGQLNDFNWDMVTFPHIDAIKPKTMQSELSVWVIPALSENRDLAFQFIQTQLSDVYKKAAEDELLNSPMKDKNLNAIKMDNLHVVPYIPTIYEDEWKRLFNKKTRDAGKMSIDYNTAIHQLQEEMQKAMDELKK